MGSCISKCKPNRKKAAEEEIEEEVEIKLQDKPVIAVTEDIPPLKPSPPPPSQKTLNPNLVHSPISPSHSSCSSSTFSCTTNFQNSSSSSSSSYSNPSLSSASSSATSVLIPKELLQSCLKPNSQIVPTKKSSGLPPHKRQRASSPNLTRQKSFRRDPFVGFTLLNQPKNKPSPLRSPSPSRRFVSHGGAMDNSMANSGYSNVKTIKNVKKESTVKGLIDPNSRSRRSFRSPSMRKEAQFCSLNRVVSQVNGISIGEDRDVKCVQDVEMLPLEDLNNPHIALDCFIFL